ncbi:MAG TPA: AraC family transcriptional regulator [Candidatus Sulfotelmatobacter sp.]|jgi:AraC-like DNA-binding protein|nr:AraC family transcriptional regulator [Candidatus Sulfotelmatobacter sp.]
MGNRRPRNEQNAPQPRPNDGQRRILAAAANGVVDFIGAQGGDAEKIFAASGVDAACLDDPVAPLALSSFVAMMEESSRQTRNDNFGLWYGHQFQPEMQGVLGDVVLAAPTVGSALANMAEMFPYHQHATDCRFAKENGLLRMEYRILDPSVLHRRQDAELTLGMVLNVCRRGLGSHWVPERVEFEHLRPEGWQAHERAFGAEVSFGHRTNALIFRDEGMDKRMPGTDLDRFQAARRHMLDVAGDARCGAPSFVEQVMSEVRACLQDGPPHIEAVAEALRLPRWTLQRRLAEAGLSFSDVVEKVRRDLAGLYVGQPHLPLSEIALALGYSELSAFTRAFTRWHGQAPAKSRPRA